MNPFFERAASAAATQWRRVRDAIRRHPWRAALLPPGLVLAYVLVLVPFTPSTANLRKAKVEAPAVLMSADGVVLATYQRVHRQWVPLAKVSPAVVQALIATEDHRFYQHHGIDLYRTAASVWHTLRGQRQGGSTLTQQLARNLYPEEIGRSATVHRKVKEAITALKIEAVYSKDEILETYLNTVPFLYNAFGIEMAARTYFDKSASQLDVLESATLIGMLKGTSYYNPVLNPERARARRNVVLTQMARRGVLPAERAQALAQRPLRVDFERQEEPLGPAPHVAQHVRKWLIAWADRNGYDVHADGLVVRSTLNTRLQRAAVQAVGRQLAQLQPLADRRRKAGEERQLVQAGFLATDPRNGHVLAWVGSSDFEKDQFDHVNQARRQPGSTFKPFVYGAAFMAGMRPTDTFVDQPVTLQGKGGEVWSPKDVTPPTGRPMTLRDGLVQSRNSITAQVMDRVGPASVAKLAQAMGVRDSRLDVVPSLALGTSPVTLREMVGAYGAIANNGRWLEPLLVLRIEDRSGKVLDAFVPGRSEQAMPKPAALALVNVMRGVVDEGTATAIRTRYGITADVAGKTGTTQDNTDGWFILAHPQLVAGAWVGFNDPRTTMPDAWGPGARSALPMVGDFFQQSLRNRWIEEKAEFDIPRPRPKPRREADPIEQIVNDVLGRILKIFQ
ncbi:MAG TPA: transglycosylase domain-containing protein [Ramlibacter sp.]|jgi:penicillin-binding protein 1A|uniref:penicillin-binding protein 1A n=1 Tax=Ramlibacter sp. TaxID=1917967 RepID=UPI002D653711|nr:transglycosylase domain-containing protein [Ramlibacter sp.]HZY18150.1 transglycosylase domain-containing protein [Ramlibacter sp.]